MCSHGRTETQDKRKFVWILGAGFSAPLGGPLLPALLSRRSISYVTRTWSHFQSEPLYERVAQLYRWGLRDAKPEDAITFDVIHDGITYQEDLVAPPEEHWADAEEFLDTIDAHDETSVLAQRLSQLASPDDDRKPPYKLAEISAAARRLVAAECVHFTRNASITQEKWEPFVEWGRELGETDTIITFNYDRVIELIGEHNEKAGRGASPVRPLAKVDPFDREPGRSVLLKLHGSVDWKCVPHSTKPKTFVPVEVPAGDIESVLCDGSDLFIATPGPSKLATASHLRALWKAAKDAIHDADVIVFIGFRFPPSDSFMRRELLGVLGSNREKTDLNLHVVLGPRIGDEASIRMARLLEYACHRHERRPKGEHTGLRYTLESHPLWGQDFLSLWTRRLL
jgi:hypothetical protein